MNQTKIWQYQSSWHFNLRFYFFLTFSHYWNSLATEEGQQKLKLTREELGVNW